MGGYINGSKELILGGFDKKVAKFVKKGIYVFTKVPNTNSITISREMKRQAFLQRSEWWQI